MTRKIHVHLIDDLDASEASETVRFEVDGRPYEIDLSSQNAERFRAEIAPYIAHARKVVSYGRRRGRASLSRPHGVAPATAGAASGPAAGMPRVLPMTGQPSPAMPVASLSRRDSAVIYITAPSGQGIRR
jgi:hypothetical protein